MTAAEVRVVAHLATIPINALLIAWVAIGRTALLPDGATDDLRLTGSVLAPVLALLLGATSVLAARGRRGHQLTGGQFAALAGIWATLAGFGFFLMDTDPTTAAAASPFTEIVGARFAPLSDALALACIHGFVAAYIALLLQLTHARARRRTLAPAAVD